MSIVTTNPPARPDAPAKKATEESRSHPPRSRFAHPRELFDADVPFAKLNRSIVAARKSRR
jgi:hypothetical protein